MKKISVHFGINEYDPQYYGKTPNLNGCVNDDKERTTFNKFLN